MRDAILPGDAKDALETTDRQCSLMLSGGYFQTHRSAADHRQKTSPQGIMTGSEVSAPEHLQLASVP